MDEQFLVHPHTVPDAGLVPARKAQRFDSGRRDVAEFEVAIDGASAIGSRPSREKVLYINGHSAAEAAGAY